MATNPEKHMMQKINVKKQMIEQKKVAEREKRVTNKTNHKKIINN